jgi:hypothetical protein
VIHPQKLPVPVVEFVLGRIPTNSKNILRVVRILWRFVVSRFTVLRLFLTCGSKRIDEGCKDATNPAALPLVHNTFRNDPVFQSALKLSSRRSRNLFVTK